MRTFAFILFIFISSSAFTADIYFNPVDGLGIPVSEGAWNNSANWSLTDGGASCNCVPQAGDNIIIPVNKKVNITTQIDFTGGSPCLNTTVEVYGEMFFVLGRKLKMGCSTGTCDSRVIVHNGGTLTPEKSNGNANYIEICDDIVWSASDGEVTGPSNLPISTLPVEYVKIDSKRINQTSVIEWSTASETNNQLFVVEHSTDGIKFEAIGTIDGNGNSNQIIDYKYTHQNPEGGLNYYRLQQHDYNGDIYLSSVTKVSHQAYTFGKLKVYPNPMQYGETLKLENSFNNGTAVTVEVYNSQSQLIYNNSISETASTVRLEDLSYQLKSGIYFIVISTNSEKISEKLIVQ